MLHEQPLVIFNSIQKFTNEQEQKNLALVSKSMYVLFQPQQALDRFLQRVSFGMQDKAEQLFTDVYRGDTAKIQNALCYQGRFTDYSGRAFHCTAYEYAYWAKDTHMRRMLERYMDSDTKAKMLARIDSIEENGLLYHQNCRTHKSPCFDFTPLKTALQTYYDRYDYWYSTHNLFEMNFAWLNVGKAQRNLPAHVAHEYCRPDRSIDLFPQLDEASLPRALDFKNLQTGQRELWFSGARPAPGLGVTYAISREIQEPVGLHLLFLNLCVADDLSYIKRLDKVRSNELKLSRKYLEKSSQTSCVIL